MLLAVAARLSARGRARPLHDPVADARDARDHHGAHPGPRRLRAAAAADDAGGDPAARVRAAAVLRDVDLPPVGGPARSAWRSTTFTYSTFLARPTLWLEDLFVLPAARGRGAGLALLRALARIAVRRGCGRMEWTVLDWNRPAIRFYRAARARSSEAEWILTRLTGEPLARLGRPQPPASVCSSAAILSAAHSHSSGSAPATAAAACLRARHALGLAR